MEYIYRERLRIDADQEKDVRMERLTEGDDIVAYIMTFERLMLAYEVKKERWAFKLVPNLTGKAQQAYAGLSAVAAGNYEKLKEAIFSDTTSLRRVIGTDFIQSIRRLMSRTGSLLRDW